MEAVSTVTVLAVLGSLTSNILYSAIDGYTSAATRGQLQGELSIGVDQIVRLLRAIERDSASGGEPAIVSVSPTSIVWNTNSSLTLSGTQLLHSDAGQPAVMLLDDVSAFSIQTYDEDDSILPGSMTGSACRAVRQIAVSISIQRFGTTESLSTTIFVRAAMQVTAP